MKRTIAVIGASIILMNTAAAHAQGISNARDGSGNLVERGAATRTYPSTPMANGTVSVPPPQGNIIIAPRRTTVIRPRH
jgi:hypothetical protein